MQEFFSSHEIMAIRIQDSTPSETDICLSSGWGVTRIVSTYIYFYTFLKAYLYNYFILLEWYTTTVHDKSPISNIRS